MVSSPAATLWTKMDPWCPPKASHDSNEGDDGMSVRVSVDLFNVLVRPGSKPKHRTINEEIDVEICSK